MIMHVNAFIESCAELDINEQNLFNTAYLNAVGIRRASLKAVCRIENLAYDHLLTDYSQRLQNDLENICRQALNLLDKHLIPAATATSSQTLYYKL